jgi:MFS transporter, ACS family, tartrate transporter
VNLWLPQMLKQHALSNREIGWVSTVPYVLASIGMVYWSTHIDRTRAFMRHYVMGCLVAATGFALSISTGSFAMEFLGISLAVVGMNACRAPLFAILPTFVAGAAAAGSIAFVNSVGNLGGFVGPYLVGWLKDYTGSFQSGLIALAITLAAAGLLPLLLQFLPRERVTTSAPSGSPH